MVGVPFAVSIGRRGVSRRPPTPSAFALNPPLSPALSLPPFPLPAGVCVCLPSHPYVPPQSLRSIAHRLVIGKRHRKSSRSSLLLPLRGKCGARGGHLRRTHPRRRATADEEEEEEEGYMEKFRHFGDAATGIHPFTFVMAPTTTGRIGSVCMFPARLLLTAVFALLLLVTDTLLWLVYVAYLGLLGRLLLAPLQRAWLRGLLFSIGHIFPQQPAAMVKPPQQEREASSSSRSARAGDLVVCNLQSVWDALVLEVMLAQPYHAICFPDATMAGEDGAASSTEAAAAPGLRVFWPGPMQRWRVWAYTRRTSSLAFLTAQQPDSAEQQAIRKKIEAMELPLYRVQKAAVRAGVPVWWFGEGTCSNGRGLLLMPAVTCTSVSASNASAGCVVHLATIQYDSPALQNVLGNDNEGFFAALFRTGLLLYGSTAPAWTSPFFPTAEVTYRSTRLARATPSTAADRKCAASMCHWTLSAPALLELRNAMCQRAQPLVVSGNTAGVRRQPLSVGVREKKGFLEAYRAMLDSKKTSPSP